MDRAPLAREPRIAPAELIHRPSPRRRRAGIVTTCERRASCGSATINPRPLLTTDTFRAAGRVSRPCVRGHCGGIGVRRDAHRFVGDRHQRPRKSDGIPSPSAPAATSNSSVSVRSPVPSTVPALGRPRATQPQGRPPLLHHSIGERLRLSAPAAPRRCPRERQTSTPRGRVRPGRRRRARTFPSPGRTGRSFSPRYPLIAQGSPAFACARARVQLQSSP